ncbi:MAG: hypothetical protein A3F11_05995 [Gammaproteobacteria bacterium RIFCSPHIGHO2_12_FULL_37_14]|nr:MAG: hypothetical protein A3F11_05995 [Gammaproteobacteria bacterium RIFCSPHIGHO2_12_FULL_37_14]
MMMLKEEQIQFEKYIDKVIKKIKIIKSGPVKTLNCLLQDYLHENSCRFSFSVPIPNHSIFDISLAKILVKRLDSLCDHEDKKINAVIIYLNEYYEKMNHKGTLRLLLSAFFSIFECFRVRLSTRLLEWLLYKDVWNDYIKLQLNSIVWNISEGPHIDKTKIIIKLAACEAIGRIASWIPKELRNDVTRSLLEYVENHKLKNQVIKSIVKLKNWIIPEKRLLIMWRLFNNIIISNELNSMEQEVCLESCDAIIQLKEWKRPVNYLEKINICMVKLSDSNPEIAIAACTVIGKLIDIIPRHLQMTFAKSVFKNIHHENDAIACSNIKALAKIPNNILIHVRSVVFQKFLVLLDCSNSHICQATCETIGRMWKFISLTDATKLLFLLKHLMDSTANVAMKISIIHAMAQFCPLAPPSIRTTIIDKLLAIISSENEESAIRIAAIHALAQLGDAITLEIRDSVANGMLTILHDEKSSAKTKDATYELLGRLWRIIPDEIRNQLSENIYQSISQELLKISLHTSHATPLTYWPSKEIALDTVVDNKINHNHDRIYSVLIRLRGLFSATQRRLIAIKLLDQLKKETFSNNFSCDFYQAFESYVDEMNLHQKICALCCLLPFTSHESSCHHHAKVLFIYIYAAYRKDLLRNILKCVPSEQNNYLPEEIVKQVMAYTL